MNIFGSYGISHIQKTTSLVIPYIYRLLVLLKSSNPNKYKSNSINWIILGILYLCINGLSIRNLTVLPSCPILRSILPPENKISIYFSSMKIHTKCVTDIGNLITSTFRRDPTYLRSLSSM